MTNLTNNQWKNLTQWLRGTMDHVPEVVPQGQLPLTLADEKRLRARISHLKWKFGAKLLLFLFAGGLFGWLQHEVWGDFPGGLLVPLIFILNSLIQGLDWHWLEKDLGGSLKVVYWGQVYRWRGPSKNYQKFYLYLTPSTYCEVQREQYKRYKLGQKVEVHVAPLSRLVLVLELRPEGDS
jgi:hypothetical protein